jgi:CheY-like chemotaxis protein
VDLAGEFLVRTKGVRLLLSSKNPTLREGIKRLLNSEPSIHIVAETTSARQTAREAMRLDPGFVLMDADMAGPATLSAIRRMKRANGQVQIWVCSLWEDADLLAACLEAGASGSVPSAADSAKLLRIFGLGKRTKSPRSNGVHFRHPLKSRVATLLIFAIAGLATISRAQQQSISNSPRPSDLTAEPDFQPAPNAENENVTESEEEHEPQDLRHFYFTSPFAASGLRETRLPVETQTVGDTAAAIALPEMTIANVQPRTEFYLSYHPTLELFSNNQNLDTATHTAGLRFAHELSPRLVVSVRNSFLRTQDPTRQLRENVFLLPRTPYQENVFSLTTDFLKNSRTKYSFEFDNTLSYLSLKNLQHTLPSDRFDQVAGGVTASVTHKIAVQQRLTGSYSFLLFRDLHTGIAESIRHAHNANITYEYGRDQRGLYVELSAGALHGSSTSYTALTRVGYAWRSLTVYTGYSRQFAFVRGLGSAVESETRLASGLSPESISQVVTLDVAATVRGHLVIDLGGSDGKGASPLSVGDIRSVTGRLQMAYRLGRVFPFLGAEFYGQNFNPLTGSRMDRSRYFAGFAVSLSPVTEAANAPVGDYSSKWPLSAPGLAPRRTSKLDKGELK